VVALGLTGVLIVLSPRLTLMTEGEATMREAFGAMLLGGASLPRWRRSSCASWCRPNDRRHRVLVLDHRHLPVAGHPALRLGLAHAVRDRASGRAGLLGGVGQILLTSSYREADASLVAPFDYASMIFSLADRLFRLCRGADLDDAGGAALIVILAGVLIIWREHRHLGLERARQRKAMTPQG
jgi:hypothetical protein